MTDSAPILITNAEGEIGYVEPLPKTFEITDDLFRDMLAQVNNATRYKAALERIAYSDEFVTLNHFEDCRGMTETAVEALSEA